VDSDGTDLVSPYTSYFIVGKGQANPPMIHKYDELMSVGSETGGPSVFSDVTLRIGPRPANTMGNADYVGVLRVGLHTGVTEEYCYGVLAAGKLAVGGSWQAVPSITGTKKGMQICAGGALELVHGADGSSSDVNYAPMYLRSWAQDLDHALAFQQLSNQDFRFSTTDETNGTDPVVFFSGSYPDISNDPPVKFCVGGTTGLMGLDPRSLPKHSTEDTAYRKSAFLAVSSKDWTRYTSVLYTNHRSDNSDLSLQTDKPHLVVFHSGYDPAAIPAVTFNYFTIQATSSTTGVKRIFSVKSNGNCALNSGAFTTTGADVAEWYTTVEVASQYPAGTVLIQTELGAAVSSSFQDRRILGVVTTQPGMLLGEVDDALAVPVKQVAVAVCGSVPVRCSTGEGAIELGDLLTSGPVAGTAVKSPLPPLPGTILGKALAALQVDPAQTGTTYGTIKVLVLNQ
jgi:hypothetical protein